MGGGGGGGGAEKIEETLRKNYSRKKGERHKHEQKMKWSNVGSGY